MSGDIVPITAASMDPDNNEYKTPPEIWWPLSRAVSGFDLDAASGAESTPIAPERYTKEDNGLQQPWFGDVWLNPPWSTNGNGSAKDEWLRKVHNEINRETVDRIIMLLPVDTSTHWFHNYVMDANAICFVGPGRISFIGCDHKPSFSLLIAVFGPVGHALADALDSLGVVIHGRSIYDPNPQTTLQTDNEEEEADQ